MNWKASLTGALLVAACGVAAGAAIGGKTNTKVLRLTVPTTVTVTVPATASATTPTSTTETGSTSTSVGTSTGTEAPPEGGHQQYLAEYLAGQNAEQLAGDASNVSLSSEPTKQELQGQTYPQAVVFNIDNEDGGNTASFQIPTPGFTRLSAKSIGLQIVANAEAYYKLTIFKNDDSSPSSVVLYQASFHGPSETHPMNIGLQGATDLLFVWTKASSEPDGQDVFILANPILTR
jgi:hypothetical protein